MKDTTSSSTTDLGDTGGGSNSEGSTPGSPDMSSLSPPSNNIVTTSSAIATAAAAAFSACLPHGTPDSIAPLLSHNPLYRTAPTAETFLAASQTAALMAATAVGSNPLRLPVSLHTTLASGQALFQQHGGGLFNWSSASVSPPPSTLKSTNSTINNNKMAMMQTVTKRNNNNHVVSSSSAAVTRKNQANVRKRATRKMDAVETTIIEVAPMTQITAAPLSPPTSGSSPPSEVVKGSSAVDIAASRDKVFTCGTCNRSFGYKHVLQNHERTHTGEKPFRCEVCEKRFTRDHHLKTHMRLHTGEKPYECTHCDRQFVQVANLRRHLRVHTGERPYACELCTSKFSDSNQLKAHMLIHKGEKPFECVRCQGRFRRRHHLMHHKCPSKDNTASILLVGLEDARNCGDKKSMDSLLSDRIENQTKGRDHYPNARQKFLAGKETSDVYLPDEEDETKHARRSRVVSSPMSTIVISDVGRDMGMKEIGDEDETLGMAVEEEEEEGLDEVDRLVTSRRIIAHNNNGAVTEKKSRIRKPREIRRVIRLPNTSSPSMTSPNTPMIVTNPLPIPTAALVLPEQTEPEDLSMSTGNVHRLNHNGYRNRNKHSHSSSGESPLSRSPSSDGDEDLDDDVPPSSATLFLQHRHPKFRRHHEHLQRSNGTAPVS